MSFIDKRAEEAYLEYVQENIFLREEELEEFRSGAKTAVADNKAQQNLRDFYRTVDTPDPDNPYFTRVDLRGGEIRYYGNIKLKTPDKCKPIPDTHSGVIENLLILSSLSDGKGYTADYPENLPDLVARTRFVIVNGKIQKISEEFLSGERTENSVVAPDVVEQSIGQTRNKRMQTISSTLQPDQFKITREPLTHSLAIQGPPGSGKTAVLLERLARIAFADESVYKKGMLLIGPNKPFMDYVANVLPTLGEAEIELKSIDLLSKFNKEVNSPISESEDLVYIKGSDEIKRVLENLVENQRNVIARSSIFKISDLTVEFSAADSLRLLESIKSDNFSTFNQQRRTAESRIRNLLVSKFQEEWIAKHGNIRSLSFDPAQLINQESAFRTVVRNMFPAIDPVGLLTKLKSDAVAFTAASNGELELEAQLTWLEEAELQGSKTTKRDVPLLDYLDYLINEPEKKWGHIPIDEAQDLSPMEMAMVSRRLDPSATLSVAGDLAQATGTQYYESWHDILQLFEQEFNYSQTELHRSYRVPSEILKYAQQFLDRSGVKVPPSEPFLERPDSLSFLVTSDNPQTISDAISLATASQNNKESVLIIAAKEDRELLNQHSFNDIGTAFVRVMDPTEVKGLEFDSVIIVNPDSILEDYAWDTSRFARLFYVLTTRSTKRLCLIGRDPLILREPLMDLEDEVVVPEAEKYDISREASIGGQEIDELLAELDRSLEDAVPANAAEEPLNIPDVSILDLCARLNVGIRQASQNFLSGNWMFAGTSQTRCPECSEKPQLIFVKHDENLPTSTPEQHIYAVACSGCFVIRDFDSAKNGSLSAIMNEIEIPKLLNGNCVACGGDK